jgi:hypothetical protein
MENMADPGFGMSAASPDRCGGLHQSRVTPGWDFQYPSLERNEGEPLIQINAAAQHSRKGPLSRLK